MKNTLKLVLVAAVVAVFGVYGCQKKPIADFKSSKTSAKIGEKISFENTSIDGHSYDWNFGDGKKSTDKNPSHSYAAKGTYTVTLAVSSQNGKRTDKKSNIITICPKGYTGDGCKTQVTPKKILISKILIEDFEPENSSGVPYDIGGKPDIFVKITKGSKIIYEQPDYIEDADDADTYTVIPSSNVILDSPLSEYTIALYDYDNIAVKELMGGVIFTPYSSTNKFPKVIDLDADVDVAFQITVSYVW